MSALRIALLQMAACGSDQEANLAKGELFCRRARAMGADIALFPEMWNVGYTPYAGCSRNFEQLGAETRAQLDARAAWQAQALGQDDPYVLHFRRLARDLEMAIALTYLERWTLAPRDTVALIDRHGDVILTYAKVHTCDFGLDAACTPGDGFHVSTLDTAHGTVNIGAMICYDREFPESARILMLNGAEIILTPNACPLEANRIGQFRARAFENMVGVAMANYAAPQEHGHSVAFDGMAFDACGTPRDTLLIEAGEREDVYLATFDLDALRAYRGREVWGNAFRRPHRYGRLTSADLEPPFIRIDANGGSYERTRR
jgi:N-carbamoylputrescine amidase